MSSLKRLRQKQELRANTTLQRRLQEKNKVLVKLRREVNKYKIDLHDTINGAQQYRHGALKLKDAFQRVVIKAKEDDATIRRQAAKLVKQDESILYQQETIDKQKDIIETYKKIVINFEEQLAQTRKYAGDQLYNVETLEKILRNTRKINKYYGKMNAYLEDEVKELEREVKNLKLNPPIAKENDSSRSNLNHVLQSLPRSEDHDSTSTS